jgi:hypothetical protein
MAHAGIKPRTTAVRSGEAELTRITGARTPTGIPVTVTVPTPAPATAAKPAAGRGRRGGARRGRRPARGAAGPQR